MKPTKQKSPHLRLGEAGEEKAKKLCQKLSLEILQLNYSKNNVGEIDIIARDGGVICFIEVKTRSNEIWQRPAEAITNEKKRKIAKTARYYRQKLVNHNILYRFDTIEVVMKDNNGKFSIRYWPDAWREDQLN